jgi:hypothetical protein
VYYNRFFVTGGGLISYGADYIDQYQHAARLGLSVRWRAQNDKNEGFRF